MGLAKAPGSLPWSDWPYALLPVLAAGGGKAESDRVLKPLQELRNLMNDRPTAKSEIATAAGRCIGELDRWLASLEESKDAASPEQIRQLIRRVACNARAPGQTAGPADWDRQAQHFLASAQLHYAAKQLFPRALPPELTQELDVLGRDLYFQPGTNGPRRDKISAIPEHWNLILQNP